MTKETIKAAVWGALFTLIVAGLIVVGSRNLAHFDAALVGYTFAVLFAVFGITYRYAMWLQRPPTAMYWKRGWQVFFRPRHLARNMKEWLTRVPGEFALNVFHSSSRSFALDCSHADYVGMHHGDRHHISVGVRLGSF